MSISDKETENFKHLYFYVLNLMVVSQTGWGQFVTKSLLKML